MRGVTILSFLDEETQIGQTTLLEVTEMNNEASILTQTIGSQKLFSTTVLRF